MFPAPLFLVLLIVTTPAFIIFDGPIVHGLVTAAAAVSVAIVAFRIRVGEASSLTTVIRPVAIVAVVPAVWMLIQLLPLKIIGLANPIWESTAAALGSPLSGSISIDPGDTLISLTRYLSVAAIAFVAAAVAVDRRRAEWTLIALTVAATLIALMVLTAGVGGFAFFSDGGPAGHAATDSAGLGVILAVAATFHMFESGRAQPPGQRRLARWHWLTFVACLIAVAICSVAVIVGATSQAYFAVACGVATLAVVVVTRRFNFGPWGYSAIISVALVVAIAAIAPRIGSRTMDLTLAFAARAPAPLIAVTQRVLTETGWAGTGAGTFAAILPIYQDLDELATGSAAPTTAAAIAVEMGRPFLWAILLAAIALVVMLLRGALQRRRDSFYSTAGASCLVAAMLLAFGNAALFSTPVLIIVAAIIGIAIAQSKSRLS
jgi:hypothetical protein